ncbi:NHLP leader peptide family RiPP precursor [Nakamurella leprariae]|uniref:NHLP leader peptide family RiPP n=1 Tax=Nakamurella leprariae TaxID=2803911 RepID=A0A938YAQ6_9ACTN|nr:NHLP leader peptide family RiPP precursor [Nakamurella leprariae]MBM9466146.1 NHLP leader peptide family RiPP precursor [Nakamurella leprariae]
MTDHTPAATPPVATLEDLNLRAATDPEFRAALLADPRRVLAELGLELPAEVSVRVVESTVTDLRIALPPALPDDVELSEDALADASGGTTPVLPIIFYGSCVGLGFGAAKLTNIL